ncbi:MAG TPA: hypothetical protein VKU36_05605 [Candidatus Babeliales bacterium]|nr:hypothetical protein [Candidatus Babeliales bacterium]
MKNIRGIVFPIALMAMLSSTLIVLSADMNFELYNKEKDSIAIQLNGQTYPVPGISTKQTLQLNVDPTREMSLVINSNTFESQRFTIDASPQRETIYLTWNPADTSKRSPLYPQTGPWLGLLGKTESGLALDKSKNVTADEIRSGTNVSRNKIPTRPIQQPTTNTSEPRTVAPTPPFTITINAILYDKILGADYASKVNQIYRYNYSQAAKRGKINLWRALDADIAAFNKDTSMSKDQKIEMLKRRIDVKYRELERYMYIEHSQPMTPQ